MNIYEIAQACGVSPATVSRVINKRPDVSLRTRTAIQKFMDDQGFTPHTVKPNNNSICLFLDNATRDEMNLISDYIAQVINGITHELFGNGYMLSVLPSWQAPQEKNECRAFIKNHHIAGCIFANVLNSSHLPEFLSRDMPTVLLAQRPCDKGFKTVSSQSRRGGQDATEYLLSMGHRRIVIYNVDGLWDYSERLEGYRKALARHGVPFDERLVYRNWYSAANLEDRLPQLIDIPGGRPTAFIVANDFEYLRLRSCLINLGYRIPEDFSVVGFDNYDYSAYCSPALTTVWQPIFDLGAHAARLILRMLGGADPAVIADVVLETKLIVRDSVARLE